MADNTTINVQAGGDLIRDVQKGGSAGPKTPVSLLDVGGAGAEVLVSAANPMPVGGVVIAPHQTGAIYNGATALTPKFAFLDASAAGATQVVAAVAGKKIRVLGFAAGPVSADVDVYFKGATTGQLTSTKRIKAGGGMGRGYSPAGHFETGVNEALQVNLSAISSVGVDIAYIEV